MLWNLANHEAEVGKPPETILPDVHLVTALAQASAANQFITEYGWNGSQGEEIRFQISPGLLQDLSIFGIYLLSHLLILFLHPADCSPVSFHPPLSSF